MEVKMFNFNSLYPRKMSEGAAGYDLFCPQTLSIINYKEIDLCVGFKIPNGYYGRICDKSSRAREGLKVMCGVIDSDYRGSIKVALRNFSMKTVVIKCGSPICQIVFERCYSFNFELVSAFSDTTKRGEGSFGSTGGGGPTRTCLESQPAQTSLTCEEKFEMSDDSDDELFNSHEVAKLLKKY